MWRSEGGHTGVWPEFVPRVPSDRRLAGLIGTTLFDETHHVQTVASWEQLRRLIEDRRLLVLTPDIRDPAVFPWLQEALADSRAELSLGADQYDLQLRGTRDGRRIFWIVSSKRWGANQPTAQLLTRLRALFDHLETPAAKSPQVLGMRLLREVWADGRRRHSLPNEACVRDLRLHAPQAWVEGEAEPGDEDPDIDDAYANHAGELPTGTSCRLLAEPRAERFPCWFMECEVEVPAPLAIGPFPVRYEEGWVRPREPGTYRAWLWRGQVEDTRAAGCTVRCLQGWGWRSSTSDVGEWAARLMRARREAPGGRRGPVGLLIKQVITGTIGTLRRGEAREVLVKGSQLGDRPFMIGGRITHWSVRTVDGGRGTPVHWHDWIVANTSRSVYRLALEQIEAGREVLAVWTDCIVLRRE